MAIIMNTRTIGILAILLLYSVDSSASLATSAVLDNVLTQYNNAVVGWANAIQARASFLFWTLATISMVWTFGILHLKNAGIGEFFGELIKFMLFTGFFDWLLINGPTYAIGIIHSMEQIGSLASGNAPTLTPTSIMDVGFQELAVVISNTSPMTQPIDSAVALIVAFVILVIIALIAINMLLLLISGWILAYAGVFFLGFGGSRWTSDIAINYYKTVLNMGAQLMTMILLIGIGTNIINTAVANMTPGINLEEMGVLLVSAIALLVLVNKVPAMIGGIAQGGGTHALGGGFGAGSAIAAMGAAATAFAAGAEMLKSAGANAIGGTQALQAAFAKQAEYDAASGGGSSMGGTPDYNSGSGSSGSSGGKSQATQSSPFSDFMGHTNSSSSSANTESGQSKSVGSILASGIKSVVQDKVQARVDQSIAGKVTNAIKNMDVPTQPEPSFGENSLAGTGETNYSDEVASFVNKSSQA